MSYELHSADSPVSAHKMGSRRPTLRRIIYLAWLLFLAMAIYAFPLYGALYPAEGTWFDSEQFWLSLCVVAGWPIAAFFLIRWQWRSAEDPLSHCICCGAEVPATSGRCRNCGQRVSAGDTAEIAGFFQLAQDGTRQR